MSLARAHWQCVDLVSLDLMPEGGGVGRVVSGERVLNSTVQKPDRLAGKSTGPNPLLGVEGTVDFGVFCADPCTEAAWSL